MPRKGHIAKRDVLADPIYNNKVVTKLINNIMLDGKKGVAQKIVYGAFDRIAEETGKPALEVFEEAMNNIMPLLEVKARRIGGATYQVPIDVRPDRRQALGLRWLTAFSRARSEKTMEERLAKEIMDAANNTGASVREKKTCTRWQRQTRHSLTTDSNFLCENAFACMLMCIWDTIDVLRKLAKGGQSVGWKRISIGQNKKHWYYGSYRCR